MHAMIAKGRPPAVSFPESDAKSGAKKGRQDTFVDAAFTLVEVHPLELSWAFRRVQFFDGFRH
jgi:hypothetical protein